MSSLAPSTQIIEYCRQLSGSNGSTAKSMNLRHMADLSACDLTYLPDQLNSLWIGPGYRSSIHEIVRNLPRGVQQLDLDLTTLAMTPEMNGHDDERTLMHLLFKRAVSLESLSLRLHGSEGVRAVAQNLHKARRLSTLDFRSNHMGDQALQVLCRAILMTSETQQDFSPIRQLILSWNDITDVGVYYLCQVLKSPRCQLQTLDLSCNQGITDKGLAALCQALRFNKSLERLTLFACSRITNPVIVKDLLIERDSDSVAAASGTCVYNYTLKYLDLGGTPARAMMAVMEQIGFGLALNRAGRLQLRCNQDDFVWILQSNLEDDNMTDDRTAPVSVKWWRPAHELVQQEDPLEDLSISFHLLRQTSAFWSKLGKFCDDEMMCD